MSRNSDVGKLVLTQKPSSKKGPLERSRYAKGGSPKGRKKTPRCGNISRTWTNKSLNKSRVLARSLHTNNRTLAKKLNAVLVELSNCEETAAALRDDNEQLRQGTRFKDEAIEDLNSMIGQIAQLLVSAGKRAQDALAWPQLETHGDTFTLEASEGLEEVKEPSLSHPEPSGAEEPQNPFQRRDRIPRTPPVQVDGEAVPAGSPVPALTHLQAKSSQPKEDSASDLPVKTTFSTLSDQSLSPAAVPDTDRLPTTAAVPDEAPPTAVISPIGRPAAPPAKPKGTVTKRKERATFSKAPDPPVPQPHDKGDPALAVYDFSMSETMNQTNLPVPSLADIRAQSGLNAAAVSKPQQGSEAPSKLSARTEAVKSESSESVSGKVKKTSSSEKVGGSETASKKAKNSKTVVAKEKRSSKTSKENGKGSKVTNEKAKCVETTEKIEKAVTPTSEKAAVRKPSPKAMSEEKNDCGTIEKIKDTETEELDEPVKEAKPVKKRVGKRKSEGEDDIEAPQPKLMKKEKPKVTKEEPYGDLEDAEDFQDFVPTTSGVESKKIEKKQAKKPKKVEKKAEQEEEEKGHEMKREEATDSKMAEEEREKEDEMKRGERKHAKKTKAEEEKKELEKENAKKKVEKRILKKKKAGEEEEEEKEEKEKEKETPKKKVEKRPRKKTKKVDEEVAEEEGGKENAPDIIGRTVRIYGILSSSEGVEKKKKFKRLVSFDDSDDSLVVPNSARKKTKQDVLLETPRSEATKTDEKEPLTNSEMLNPLSSCNRPRRAKAVSLKEPSARGKLRRGDPEWCRPNV